MNLCLPPQKNHGPNGSDDQTGKADGATCPQGSLNPSAYRAMYSDVDGAKPWCRSAGSTRVGMLARCFAQALTRLRGWMRSRCFIPEDGAIACDQLPSFEGRKAEKVRNMSDLRSHSSFRFFLVKTRNLLRSTDWVELPLASSSASFPLPAPH